MTKNLIAVASLLILASCAHHRDVRPSDSGVHKVSFQTETKHEGHRNALNQANHFCEQSKKLAYVVKEEVKYTGRIKEDTYNDRKAAAKITKGVGAGVFALGGKKEKDVGGILGVGGQVADSAIGKGYTYTMQFKCK